MKVYIYIGISLFLIALLTYIIIKKRWDLLDKILFGIVTIVEREFGEGTGQLKLSEAIQRVYPYIPAFIRWFISQKTIVKLIEKALDKAKQIWNTNENLIK